MTPEELKQTLDGLKARFTDDKEHNLQILRDFCATLSDSPEDMAALSAIAHFAAAEYPDADVQALTEKLSQAITDFHNKLTQAQMLAKERNFEAAASLFAEITGDLTPKDDPKQRRLAFSHPFEEMLFRAQDKDPRPIVRVSNLSQVIFYQYGTILLELRRLEDARTAFNHCLTLNPIDVRAMFELGEIAKLEQDFDGLRALMVRAHPLIFTRHMLARYYRNQAFLANFEAKMSLAVAMVYVSLDYEESPLARAQLNALAKIKGVNLTRPKTDDVKALVQGTDIVLGPSETVYHLALSIAQSTRKQHPQIAKMALSIAYDITHYQPLLKEIAQLGG
ncbi:MAG: hypothetical protein FWC40_05700 [Proteobacteria bacterium]|nr:hypothetical protein [Pseudomonadota bacterium]